MIKLYLKTLAIVIVLTCLMLSMYQFGFSYFTRDNFNSINRLISKGTFSYIQATLAKTPESNWESAIKKLQPSDTPLAEILSIKSLQLNKKDKSQLLNGNIVFSYEKKFHFSYFLYYGMFESFALQRIEKSDFALKIILTQPINQTIKSTMLWITQIISHELNGAPKEKWPLVLKNLQITFKMPIKLIPKNSDIITNKMRHDLSVYAMAYSNPEADKPISTLYFQAKDPEMLLVIGPIQYSPLSSLFSMAQRYYFISFTISSIFIVIFLTWLFSRNVLKIYQLTRKYSQGNFNVNTKISHASILHGIYQNIIAMGASLNRLIKSQHNMTRFVAHEVRTPLSTMQLALDSLKKEDNLSQQSQNNLVSIQEDIREINKLISYFFLYYQSASHELKLKTEILNISDWLDSVVKRYALSKIKVTFVPFNKENIFLNVDPSLVKHVFDNLMTNALKFAKENIIISLEADKHHIKINVDDDGPGMPQSEIKNIFEPFNTLNDDQTFGKHIGLGLTIAKSIIELHKGSIAVSNSPELGGARFSIILPR